jgi:protein TonB
MKLFGRPIPAYLIVSVLLHTGLVGGLFFVVGVVGREPIRDVATRIEADPESPEEIEPEPPEVEPVEPPPTPEPPDAKIREEPIEEPEVFVDETDPEDAFADPDLRMPTDVPPIRVRSPIGIGGGNVGRAPPPPPPPKPKEVEPKGPTREAKPKRAPGPSYPRRAADRGYEGKVELLVEVLPDGSIGEIEVTVSSGYRILDEEAIKTVRTWNFEPALIEGRPVRSLVAVPFSFELKERR